MTMADPVPAAHCRVCLMVAPVKPATKLTRVAAKGKAIPCPVTLPQVHKTTWLTSPSPGVAEVTAPAPPVAGPSQVMPSLLFEGPDLSGEEGGVGWESGALVPSGTWPRVW